MTDPFQPHDLGCRCWPHIGQRDAIEAMTETARLECLDSVRVRREARAAVIDDLAAKARRWRDDGMFTDSEWGAVCAVLFVSDVVSAADFEWAKQRIDEIEEKRHG